MTLLNGRSGVLVDAAAVTPLASPPLVSGLPLLGNLLSLLRDPLKLFRDSHARHGDVFELRAPGRRLLILAGLEANRWMGAEGRDALESGTFWTRLTDYMKAPHAIVALDGADHMLLRRLYRDDLNARVVEERADRVVELIQAVMATRTQGETSSCVGFMRQIVSLEVNLLLSDENALDQWGSIAALLEYFRWVNNVKSLAKWPRIVLWLPRFRKLKRASDRFLARAEARAKAGNAKGFVQSGVEAQKQYPHLFTDGDLAAHVLLGYVAGADTVGVTLTLAMRELLRDQRRLWKRVRKELDAACEANGGELPPPAELKALPDLMGTCYETLRLYPPGFAMGRHAAKDFEFAGYQVKKGAQVIVFTTGTHVDPEYFPDPYRFDIERYRPPREEHRRKYAYSPYGRGPHVCLGAAMAELMLPLTLATLIRQYDFSLARPDKEYRTVYDPSTTLPKGFEIRYDGPRRI